MLRRARDGNQGENKSVVFCPSGKVVVIDMSVPYCVLYTVLYCTGTCTAVNWLEWWTYDGISGPSFWGLINPEWALCNQVWRSMGQMREKAFATFAGSATKSNRPYPIRAAV